MFGFAGRWSSALSVRAGRSRGGLDVDAQAHFEGNRFRHCSWGGVRSVRSLFSEPVALWRGTRWWCWNGAVVFLAWL